VDVGSGAEVELVQMGDVSSVAFSPDGTRIVAGSYDQSLRVWNIDQVLKRF